MTGEAHRERIIEAATRITVAEGWSAITMARLADQVGVSRQTVYNEVGGKAALAEAIVLTELAAFLAVVDAAFDEHADPVDAIRQAVREVLALSRAHPLLAVILAPGAEAESDLLAALTSQSTSLIDLASAAVDARLVTVTPTLTPQHRRAVVDMVVRTVLSHVVQPGAAPTAVADDLAWLTGRAVLTRETAPA